MTISDQLPRVDVAQGRDEGDVYTVEYLNYEVLAEHGWDLGEEDLFEKAAAADLDEDDYGTLEVNETDYILKAAEDRGLEWPFSCRESSCATCAAVIVDGEVDMKMNNVLSEDEIDEENVRLTCVSKPKSDGVKLVYNARHLEFLQGRAHF